jgi:hypothetical protein
MRIKHRLGWLGITILMSPALYWVWMPAQRPVRAVFSGAVPWFVISGKVFTEPFDNVHAGSAMDQPTIGKWLFWFTFMTVTSLPYVAIVGWLADRRKKSGRIVYGVFATILCTCLLCMLTGPFLWLVQYVCSMGFTSNRVFGLLYSAAGGSLVGGFLYWAVRKPPEPSRPANACTNCSYDLTGNISGVCPECGTTVGVSIPSTRPHASAAQ